MTGQRTLIVLFTATILMSTAVALPSDATLARFYIHSDGTLRATTPTNEEHARVLEAEGRAHSARTGDLPHPLRIASGSAFALHLHDRESHDPLDRRFTTGVVVSVHNGDFEVMTSEGCPAGQPTCRWHLAAASVPYTHPGGEPHGEGWTDLTLSTTTALPTTHHCNADGCIRFEHGALVVPAGMRIALETGLVRSASCTQDVCGAVGASIQEGRESTYEALNATSGALAPHTCGLITGCASAYNPAPRILGPNFHSFHQANQTLREWETGRPLQSFMSGVSLPRASWQLASTTSDSRLEIRLA